MVLLQGCPFGKSDDVSPSKPRLFVCCFFSQGPPAPTHSIAEVSFLKTTPNRCGFAVKAVCIFGKRKRKKDHHPAEENGKQNHPLSKHCNLYNEKKEHADRTFAFMGIALLLRLATMSIVLLACAVVFECVVAGRAYLSDDSASAEYADDPGQVPSPPPRSRPAAGAGSGDNQTQSQEQSGTAAPPGSTTAWHHKWMLHELGNPLIEPLWCGRSWSSHVCNPDGVASEKAVLLFDTLLDEIGKVRPAMLGGSYCSIGYQMYLAIVQSIDKPSWMAWNNAGVSFAENLLDDWGVGDPVCQNGIVFLFDSGDRIMSIATGKGAQTVLTIDKIREVYESMKPALRMEDWDRALEAGLRSTYTVLQGGVLEPERDNSTAFLNGIWLILVLVIICCVWQSCTEHCYERDELEDLEKDIMQDLEAEGKHRQTERLYGANGGLTRYPDYHGQVAEPTDEYVLNGGNRRSGDLNDLNSYQQPSEEPFFK
eukprot:g10177.t1